MEKCRIEIRWVQQEDIQELGFAYSEAYRNAYQGIVPDEYLAQITPQVKEAYFHTLLTQERVRAAIALMDERIAGCMVLTTRSDDDLHSRSGEITAIYLLQEYRGNGLGKKLLEWGIEKLKAFACPTVAIWVLRENSGAIRFYEKQGFVRDGAERLIRRGQEFVQYRYVLGRGKR